MSDPTPPPDPRPPQYEGFIDAVDIGYDVTGGKAVTVTIDTVAPANSVKDATGRVVDKEVVYFAKAAKGLILNKTNLKCLVLLHGKDRARWHGKPATLTVRFVDAFGEKDAPVIRVLPPKGLPLPIGMRKWLGAEKPKGK